MDDGPRLNGGLDPSRTRGPRRSPWGRRHAYGHKSHAASGERGAPIYAALDLGTNNCRLLVARPTYDSFRVVDAFSRIIRLGEGISSTGRISEAAIDRAVGALSVCRDKIVARGVTRTRLIATEACRAAENGDEFIARIRDVVGLQLEIIDRQTEARLAATGCTPLVLPTASSVVLFDIGGGSTEIVNLGSVNGQAGPPKPIVRDWASLPVGVVTLAERHGGIEVTRATFEAMVAEVAGHLAPFVEKNRSLNATPSLHMLGTSGTVTTVAGVHLGLKRYDRRQIDGCWMTASQIDAVLEQLLDMRYEDRVANACIGAERADLVLAGCAILEAIRRAFPCERLRVADRGLREGMLVEMMREDNVWRAA